MSSATRPSPKATRRAHEQRGARPLKGSSDGEALVAAAEAGVADERGVVRLEFLQSRGEFDNGPCYADRARAEDVVLGTPWTEECLGKDWWKK